MRVAMRFLANVKPERFLEAGNPTGLTGLLTHATPRPTLLHLYQATLERLKTFPEHSVYRKAAEAVTLHRMQIVESVKPHGYEEWLEWVEQSNKEIKELRGKAFAKDVDRRMGEESWVEKESLRLSYEEINKLEEESSHEPPLESSQIAEIENQIGGGLIEEVIQVAEGELKLAAIMSKSKVWEHLEEKAPEGQWEYFARDQHVSGTQEPPK